MALGADAVENIDTKYQIAKSTFLMTGGNDISVAFI